jgi:hypothetical protein
VRPKELCGKPPPPHRPPASPRPQHAHIRTHSLTHTYTTTATHISAHILAHTYIATTTHAPSTALFTHCSDSSLLTVHCSLFTVHCSLFTVHCSLLPALCSLLTAHRSLHHQKIGRTRLRFRSRKCWFSSLTSSGHWGTCSSSSNSDVCGQLVIMHSFISSTTTLGCVRLILIRPIRLRVL